MKILLTLLIIVLIFFTFIIIYQSIKNFISAKKLQKNNSIRMKTAYDYPGYPGGYVFYWKKICEEDNNIEEITQINKFIKENDLSFDYDRFINARVDHDTIMIRRSEIALNIMPSSPSYKEGTHTTSSMIERYHKITVKGDNCSIQLLTDEFKRNEAKTINVDADSTEIVINFSSNFPVHLTLEGDNCKIQYMKELDISIFNNGDNNKIKPL